MNAKNLMVRSRFLAFAKFKRHSSNKSVDSIANICKHYSSALTNFIKSNRVEYICEQESLETSHVIFGTMIFRGEGGG